MFGNFNCGGQIISVSSLKTRLLVGYFSYGGSTFVPAEVVFDVDKENVETCGIFQCQTDVADRMGIVVFLWENEDNCVFEATGPDPVHPILEYGVYPLSRSDVDENELRRGQ